MKLSVNSVDKSFQKNLKCLLSCPVRDLKNGRYQQKIGKSQLLQKNRYILEMYCKHRMFGDICYRTNNSRREIKQGVKTRPKNNFNQ